MVPRSPLAQSGALLVGIAIGMMSRKEIDKTLDDLAPTAVRGHRSDSPLNGLIVVAGPGRTTIVEYENVTVQIDSAVIGVARKEKTVENVAAVIRWKNRKCK